MYRNKSKTHNGNTINRSIYIHLNSTEELENLMKKYGIIDEDEYVNKYVSDVVYQ